MAGHCECGNEPSGSIKYGEFFDWLRKCQFLLAGLELVTYVVVYSLKMACKPKLVAMILTTNRYG